MKRHKVSCRLLTCLIGAFPSWDLMGTSSASLQPEWLFLVQMHKWLVSSADGIRGTSNQASMTEESLVKERCLLISVRSHTTGILSAPCACTGHSVSLLL